MTTTEISQIIHTEELLFTGELLLINVMTALKDKSKVRGDF